MSSSDETYLEAFIESLSTLPHQVRRNMELMKDLDKSCNADIRELRQLQQKFLLAAEDCIMERVELVVEDNDDEESSQQQGGGGGVRVKRRRDDDDDDDEGDDENNTNRGNTAPPTKNPPAIIPTTEEWIRFVFSNNATAMPSKQQQQAAGGSAAAAAAAPGNNTPRQLYPQIQAKQGQCLQKADEKCAIAQQAYEMVDAVVQRLDRDVAQMETLLQSTGEFHTGVGGTAAGKPNDLAACQVSPGSEWILAKVILFDPATAMYKLSDEDTESNKVFHLPHNQVVVLGTDNTPKLSRGDVVYAVYPDTTSFYQATVVQAPRKASAPGAFVIVNFLDDSDEFGITHDKGVPLKHVMLPPPHVGATVVHA